MTPHRFRTFTFAFLMTGLAAADETTQPEPAPAFAPLIWSVYAQTSWFDWSETVEGARFVDEEGLLTGVGVSFRGRPRETHFVGALAFWVGQVDYDGGLQDGTPYQDETDYAALELELGLSVPLWLDGRPDGPALGLHTRLGQRRWDRDLRTSDPGVIGYVEEWRDTYLRLGVFAVQHQDSANGLFASLGALRSVDTQMTVEDDGLGNVSLSPEGQTTLYLTLGYRDERWAVELFHEQREWGQSASRFQLGLDPDEGLVAYEIYQPSSRERQTGLRVLWRF